MRLSSRTDRARRFGVRTAIAAALLGLVATATACAQPAPTLTVTTVVGGLNHPWDLAFTPDGTMLFTERAGRVDAFVGGQTRVLAAPTDLVVQNETGMLGLAVDPQFSSNRRIYTCQSSNASGAGDLRVVRWTVDAGYTKLENRTDILPGITYNDGYQASPYRFVPVLGPTDGVLFKVRVLGSRLESHASEPESPRI